MTNISAMPKSAIQTVQSRSERENAETPDVVALYSAVSAILRDTIASFREVSGRVTETVMSEGDRANPEIIVMLQDFDRLEQQFSALNDVLLSCNDAWKVPYGVQNAAAVAMNGITLADLKTSLINKVKNEELMMATSSMVQDDVF